MNRWILDTEIDLTRASILSRFRTIYYGDALANVWRCTIFDDGDEADLTGYSVEGVFLRADGATVNVAGVIVGNVVTITLPSACYTVAGNVLGTIVLEKDNDRVTIDAATFRVETSSSETVVPIDEAIVHIGTEPLDTTSQTLSGAINELVAAVEPITNAEIDAIMA